MDREKKKFHWSKAKVKRCMKGSISILLCLLLTPFLTVTLGLIEYARYQEVMEIADELMELTELFVLADYDPYVHDRFGMLSVSQEGAVGDRLETVLVDNAKITGDQLVPSNVSVTGKFTLKENDILQQQILDFSQFTTPTAVLMEDLRLEELLNKLKSLESFANITNTVGQLADATESVTKAVEALGTLKSDMTALQTSILTAKSQATELAGKFSTLIERLGNEGITLPASASAEDIQAAIQAFVDDGNGSESLLTQIKDIYTGAKELKDSLDNIKTSASAVKTSAGNFRTAVQDAANAIKSVGDNDVETNQNISGKVTTTVDSIIQEMEELVNTTLTEIKDETIQTMDETADAIIDTILEDTGLSGVVDRYTAIANGSYFSIDDSTLTISDDAKQDIIDFLKMAHGVYNDARSGGGDVGASIKNYFVGRFVPNLNFDPSTIVQKINTILSEAESTLAETVDSKLSELLEKLGNLLTQIFSLSVFADTRLNSVVTLSNADINGAQRFIDAVNALIGAINDFRDSIGSFNLLGALKAMGDLLGAIKDMFSAILLQVQDILRGISGLGGGWNAIYDRLVVSGYMIHTLPCRIDATSETVGGVVQLNGKSLTGYSYNDIPRGGNTFEGAELEYVYKGTNDEIANQTLTFWDIYFLRLLLDMPSVFFTDSEVTTIAAAANIAAWVVYIIYLLAEPFLDTLLLVNGEKVPFIKNKCWLTVTGMTVFIPKLANAATECEDLKTAANDYVESFKSDMGDDVGGSVGYIDMDYRNYLLIMLTIMVSTNKQVQRLGNLIDLEATQYYQEQGKTFNIAQTYTALEVSADMTFNPFVDLGILAGDGPLNISGRMTRRVSY